MCLHSAVRCKKNIFYCCTWMPQIYHYVSHIFFSFSLSVYVNSPELTFLYFRQVSPKDYVLILLLFMVKTTFNQIV
jgi:hypothetical protein